jgi:hypothetical protein
MSILPRDGSGRRDGCAQAEGVGSIQTEAMTNAITDCAQQLGIGCGAGSPSLDWGALRCVSKRAPDLILKACAPFARGIGWICKGPVPFRAQEGSHRDGCAYVEGEGSTQLDAMLSASEACSVQLTGSACAVHGLEINRLTCVGEDEPPK